MASVGVRLATPAPYPTPAMLIQRTGTDRFEDLGGLVGAFDFGGRNIDIDVAPKTPIRVGDRVVAAMMVIGAIGLARKTDGMSLFFADLDRSDSSRRLVDALVDTVRRRELAEVARV